MTTKEKSITELLEQVHQLPMTDVKVAAELGVTGQTVYRWRNGRSPVQLPKLVRAALLEILEQE